MCTVPLIGASWLPYGADAIINLVLQKRWGRLREVPLLALGHTPLVTGEARFCTQVHFIPDPIAGDSKGPGRPSQQWGLGGRRSEEAEQEELGIKVKVQQPQCR